MDRVPVLSCLRATALALLVGLCGAAEPAAAALPAAVGKASAALRQMCRGFGGQPGKSTGIAHAVDLTGDGIVDFVLSPTAIDCEGAGASAMEGGQLFGAEFTIFLGQPDGTARKALDGHAFALRLDNTATPNRLLVEVAGSACGQRDAANLPVSAVEHCERPLLWQPGVGRFALGPKVVAAPSGATAAAPEAAPPAAPRDLCAGRAPCYDGRTFSAQVVRAVVSGCRNRSDAAVLFATVRVTNQSARPLVLAYQAGSVRAIDNLGSRWSPPGACEEEVRGMGRVTQSQVDSDFLLAPGESREATLAVWLQLAPKQPRGSSFNLEFGLEQYAPLPGRQVQRVRTHSVSFNGLTEMGGPVGGIAGAATAPQDAARSIKSALDALRQLKK